MLKQNETNNPNAIEKYVINKMRSAKKQPLPHYLDEIFKHFIAQLPYKNNFPEVAKSPLMIFIEDMVENNFRYNISDQHLTLVLTHISKTNEHAMLYLWYLQWWSKTNNFKELSLDLFNAHIFPDGFPDNNTLNQIWLGQKLQTGANLVDYTTAGKSILTH